MEKQREWIRGKKEEENDYHMIIEDFKGNRFGTIALYNIKPDLKTFEWGRWVIFPGSPFYVPVESIILAFNFAFNILLLEESIFGTQALNHKTFNILKKVGSEIIRSDNKEIWFSFNKKNFPGMLARYRGFHKIQF